jgi:hypothetical protein
MPQIIGELPKPRVLVVNPEGNSAAAIEIEKLAPTVRYVTNEELRSIRQRDWDAAVIFGDAFGLEDHLYAIQFGGQWGGRISVSPSQPRLPYLLIVVPQSRSIQFIVPDTLPSTVRPLVSSLVSLARSTSPNLVMWAGIGDAANLAKPDIVQPFLEDADHFFLAGCYLHPQTYSRWWWLPADIDDPARWVAAALADWRDADRDKFPSGPSWRESEAWATPAELKFRERATALQEELDKFIHDIEQRQAEIIREQEEAFVRANNGDRRLITAQGDDLVDEVQAALEEIGFIVTNVDRDIASEGDRREDLRVQDPDNLDWVAIVEVRGYKRGAQLTDLLRIGRFVARYVEETGKIPAASWYVVNHNLSQDPAVRPSPLASNPSEVSTFADGGGLIIDSRFLFRMRMKVQSGSIEPQLARAVFSSSTGILSD